MKPWQVISELESNNSRLFKESVLKREASNNNDELFTGFQLALNPTVTFGVKKVPTHGGPDGQGLPWKVFAKLADQLQKRELTGHDARDAIELALSAATQNQWNDWYRRILIKDLRCGVSEKTVNAVVKKGYPQYRVPVFTCQLAHDGAKHEKKICGKKLIEVKLDGVRVLTIVYPQGRVEQFSRNGKELLNFGHIKMQIAATASKFKEPMVLDGEVMSDTFQDLMKQVRRKKNVSAGDAVLHLFDIVTLKDFMAGKCKTSQLNRSASLEAWFYANEEALPNVQVLSYEAVDLDTPTGQSKFAAINNSAIRGGYEGIMIKDPAAPYECKRTKNWLKQKPFIEVSLKVVGFEAGTGRNVNRLGAMLCEGKDDGKFITVSVGGGYSDQQRDEFWTDKKQILGMIAEVRADAITQNQDGSYSLRFPRFKGFRGFEPGEKI